MIVHRALAAFTVVAACGCAASAPPPSSARPPLPRLIGSMAARIRAADSEQVPFERVPAALAAPAVETRPQVATSRIRLSSLPEASIPPPLTKRDAPASVARVRVPPSGEPELVLVGVPDDPPGPFAPVDADLHTMPVRVHVTDLALSEVGFEDARWSFRAEQVDDARPLAHCGGRGVVPIRGHGVRRRQRADALEYVVVDGWFDRARCAVTTARRTIAVAAPLVPGIAYAFREPGRLGAPEGLTVLMAPGQIATAARRSPGTAGTAATFTRVTFVASGDDLGESLVAMLPVGDGEIFRSATAARRGPPDKTAESIYLAIDVVDDGEPVAITAVGLD